MKTLKNLKKGDYFTLKPISEPKENQVYIKDEYDRSEKKYICYKFNNIGDSRLFKSDRIVYTDFIF